MRVLGLYLVIILLLLLLVGIVVLCRCSLLLQTEYHSLSVSLSVTIVSPEKRQLNGLKYRLVCGSGRPRNHVLDGGLEVSK